MKYVDLSHKIKNEMPNYPGDLEVSLEKEHDYDIHSYNNYIMKSGMHTGTHIDAPLHMLGNKKFISEYSIESFAGNAVLLDVRGEKDIGLKDQYYKDIKENDIVLFYTGWDSNYGKEEYYTCHPVISEELAEFLVRKKIKMIGMDMPSPDNKPFNVHKVFLGNNIFILENLTNLNDLLYIEELFIFAQPLKIEAEASLVRAIAVYQGY